MSWSRRNTSSPEGDSPSFRGRSPPIASDATTDGESHDRDAYEQSQIDQLTGQAGAFPGLGRDAGELFYGPARDGLDYLRMVRSERHGIPHLLSTAGPWPSGTDETRENNNHGDVNIEHGDFFQDGAYTARSRPVGAKKFDVGRAQQLCYVSLLSQFDLVRATLRCMPPLSAIESLRSSQPISFPAQSEAATKIWEKHLLEVGPSPVQVACMDNESLFETIKLVTKQLDGYLMVRDELKVERLGAWIWALLGKCPDRGELGSEEISDLRALAQVAYQLASDLACDNSVTPEVLDDQNIVEAPSSGEILTRFNRTQRSVISAESSDISNSGLIWSKLMVMDIIITIVGEVYGQRDLLDLRQPWKNVANDLVGSFEIRAT